MADQGLEKVKDTGVYRNFRKLIPAQSEEKVAMAAGVITTLVGVVWVDGKVTRGEANHLLKQIDRLFPHFPCPQEAFNLGLLHYQKSPKMSHYLTVFLDHLNQTLDEKNKTHLIEILYSLSASDQDMDLAEENYIERVNHVFGLSKSTIAGARASAALNLFKTTGEGSELLIVQGSEAYEF